MGEERIHGLQAPRASGRHEHRLPAQQGRVGVGARLEQQAHDVGVRVRGRERQRPHAVAVPGVGVGARADEEPGRRRVVAIDGPVQGGHAVDLGRVDVRAAVDEHAHQLRATLLRRVHEGGVPRRFGRARCRRSRCDRDRRSESQRRAPRQSSPVHLRSPVDRSDVSNRPTRRSGRAGSGAGRAVYTGTASTSASTRPLLSPNESRWTPTRSSSVRCRLASGVPRS